MNNFAKFYFNEEETKQDSKDLDFIRIVHMKRNKFLKDQEILVASIFGLQITDSIIETNKHNLVINVKLDNILFSNHFDAEYLFKNKIKVNIESECLKENLSPFILIDCTIDESNNTIKLEFTPSYLDTSNLYHYDDLGRPF